MLFNSFDFILFLIMVLTGFYGLPPKARVLWLLLSSCYFYMDFIPVYILFLFLLIAIDYTAGRWIEGTQGTRRRAALVISLCANLLLLGLFKYFNFFAGLVSAAFLQAGHPVILPHWSWALPLGLSFHTFQSMAYTMEVYRGTVKAERRIDYYALYVLFFPQLVAGPIERPQHLLPQLHQPKPFDPALAVSGLRLILWGFFKKLIVADRLAEIVDFVYLNPAHAPRGYVVIATYFFAFQIYMDFSGYTDIARGTAQLFGIRLMENFRQPYMALSIVEFWRRWHISLSTWFRDYVYLPLGGSRASVGRTLLNILVVFLLSGLWHGANLTFVVWGLYHGLLFAVYRFTVRGRERASSWCRSRSLEWFWTLLSGLATFHAVCLGWVFFRANSLSEAFALLRLRSESGWVNVPTTFEPWLMRIALIVIVMVYEGWPLKKGHECLVSQWSPQVRWACYYGVILILMFYGKWGDRQFIYFQF